MRVRFVPRVWEEEVKSMMSMFRLAQSLLHLLMYLSGLCGMISGNVCFCWEVIAQEVGCRLCIGCL